MVRSDIPSSRSCGCPRTCPRTSRPTVYFVVAEAMTNVAKHSGAERVSVHVRGRRRRGHGVGSRTTAAAAPTWARARASPDSPSGSPASTARSRSDLPGRRSDGAGVRGSRYEVCRLVVADDSVLLREGLQLLLAEAGHEVVAAVGDGPAYVAAVLDLRPDASIVDVRMPPSHTDEGLRAAVDVRSGLARGADHGALPVRRGVVRRRPARVGRGRHRLPAQGPGQRRRRLPARPSTASPTAAPCSTRSSCSS